MSYTLKCPRCQRGVIQLALVRRRLIDAEFAFPSSPTRIELANKDRWPEIESESDHDEEDDGFECSHCGEIWAGLNGLLRDIIRPLRVSEVLRGDEEGEDDDDGLEGAR